MPHSDSSLELTSADRICDEGRRSDDLGKVKVAGDDGRYGDLESFPCWKR